MINTKKVTDRRKFRFETSKEAVRDAEALAAAERDASLRATGNWSLGQALGHLAFWANAPFDGYPPMKQPPWFVRILFRFMKNGCLNKKMPSGVRIPDVEEGTFGVERLPTDEGLAAMRNAFVRIASTAPTVPNPIFGDLSHEEWIKLNLRHAELHLSFFHPASPAIPLKKGER